jgi:hypothetical protein
LTAQHTARSFIFLLRAKYYSSDEVKERNGGGRGVMCGDEKYIQDFGGEFERKEPMWKN